MSRFKFKVWDQVEKLMIDNVYCITFGSDGFLYSFHYRVDDTQCINPMLDEFRSLREGYEPEHFRFIPLPYTGFKDMNGKEIYDGDIITALQIYDKVKGKVCHVYGGWCLRMAESEDSDYYYEDIIELDNRVITGNVYQNPDMIDNPCVEEEHE